MKTLLKFTIIKIYILFILITSVLLLVLNISFGTYFEHYDSVINAFLLQEFIAQISYTFLFPPWYALTYVFSVISINFPNIPVYSIACTFFNIVILSSLLTCMFTLTKYHKIKTSAFILIMAITLFVFLDNLIYNHNSRITFFLFFSAMFWFFTIKRLKLDKRYYLFGVFLTLLSVLTRIEILMIVSSITVVFTFLFYKKLLKISLLIMLTSFLVFGFYKIYQKHFFPDQVILYQAEHEFYDRYNISIDDYTKGSASYYKLFAMFSFVQDKAVIDIEDYDKLINKNTLFEYFFNNDKFVKIYKLKLKDLWFDLIYHNYLWLIVLAIILCSYAIYHLLLFNKFSNLLLLKIFFFLLFIISVPLVINLYLSVPYNLIVSIFISLSLLSLIFLVINFDKLVFKKVFFSGILVFLFASNIFYLSNVYEFEDEKYSLAESVRNIKVHYNDKDKILVFASLFGYENYPSKLFSSIGRDRISHYNVDLFFLRNFNMYLDHNKSFFGKEIPYLKHRILKVANNENHIFISNDNYNEFLQEYLRIFHDVDLFIQPLEVDFELFELKPYYIFTQENLIE